ncbi:MAG TPA: LexA family transcriptional regulator [Candidatus Babeliales bacterium]|nr:LexA family transcriptional regulator [Candidatus Babeliales bacterium]
MNNTKIGKILNQLLSEQNLRVAELARRVQLPQPTVQRIVAGVCANPQTSSLKPIADYFSITVDQLKGLDPIPRLDKIQKLPLISWQEAVHWNTKLTASTDEHVIADLPLSKHAYALRIHDGAMEPVFPCDSILIVDPDVKPKDRSYVISLMHNADIPIFRQMVINGPDKYLKPLSPDTEIYKMLRLGNADNILATVVQARWNYTG